MSINSVVKHWTPLGVLDFANASPYLRKMVMYGLSLPMEL